jgi:hypothetical protein
MLAGGKQELQNYERISDFVISAILTSYYRYVPVFHFIYHYYGCANQALPHDPGMS